MWYWTVMWSLWKVLSPSGKANIDSTQWASIQTSELRCQVTCSFNCSVCSIHEGLLVKKGFFHAVFLSRICDSLFDHEDWIVVFQWKSSAWSCFPTLLKMRTNSPWRKARQYKLSGKIGIQAGVFFCIFWCDGIMHDIMPFFVNFKFVSVEKLKTRDGGKERWMAGGLLK